MTGALYGQFKIIAALGLAVTLGGCEDGQGPQFDFLKKKDDNSATISTESASSDVEGAEGIEREVEKPDVFNANEPALWDGRPSLGGVWVASPGVKDPERVIIRNLENGKSIVGALFRRERDNPGPRLQLSSDAAVELGVLAGAPTKISVVALRTETIAPVVPVALPTPDLVDAPALSDAPAIEADTAALDAVQIDPIEAAAIEGNATDGFNDPEVFVPEPEPSGSPSSMPNIFNRNNSQSGGNAANSFDATADAATSASAAAVGTAVETTTVTTQTLDPIQAAQDALDRSDAEVSQAPAAISSPVIAQKSTSALAKPYIQIGIFSVKENADKTATKLKSAGVLPVVLKQQSAGRSIWRVIVGPARTNSDKRALNSKVKGLGYADAYFVTD